MSTTDSYPISLLLIDLHATSNGAELHPEASFQTISHITVEVCLNLWGRTTLLESEFSSSPTWHLMLASVFSAGESYWEHFNPPKGSPCSLEFLGHLVIFTGLHIYGLIFEGLSCSLNLFCSINCKNVSPSDYSFISCVYGTTPRQEY